MPIDDGKTKTGQQGVPDSGTGKKKQPEQDNQEQIRPAGPEGAGVDPEEWDIVDEESDESFPASDAPSHY